MLGEVCHVTVVPDVAVSTCPIAGAVAANTLTAVLVVASATAVPPLETM